MSDPDVKNLNRVQKRRLARARALHQEAVRDALRVYGAMRAAALDPTPQEKGRFWRRILQWH